MLKKKLYLYMRSYGKTEWEKYIFFICDNLNNCSMAAIGGISPASVNELTEYKVRKAQENKPFLDWHQQEENVKAFAEKTPAQRKVNLGDYVYKSYSKDPMGKSFDIQRLQLYIVIKILAAKDPVRYELSDIDGNPIPGSYYQEQLVVCPKKPSKDQLWLVKPQESYKERRDPKTGKKQIYVQWLLYPASKGEWIDKDSLESAAEANEIK